MRQRLTGLTLGLLLTLSPALAGWGMAQWYKQPPITYQSQLLLPGDRIEVYSTTGELEMVYTATDIRKGVFVLHGS